MKSQLSFILILLLLLLLSSCCKNDKISRTSKNQSNALVAENNQETFKEIKEKQDTIFWKLWFDNNSQNYIYLFDEVSEKHKIAINDLLTLFYNGADSLRHDFRMIQWRLDEFYPINDHKATELGLYYNLEKQIDSLLNFKVEKNSYQQRHKSALMRLMYDFKLNLYEFKLRNLIADKELKELFEQEQKMWEEYYEATSIAFEKIVLGKSSYYLKYTFWNNYDFDIMTQRVTSLLYMYFKDSSIWEKSKTCKWHKVEEAYDNLQKQLRESSDFEYEYSYEDKLNALTLDKNSYMDFMKTHTTLLQKLKLSEETYLLYQKYRTLCGFMDSYNIP